MTGQHVRSSTDLLGQCSILTGHCPLTGRYFKPCIGYDVSSLDPELLFLFVAGKEDEVSPVQLHFLNQSSRKVKDTVAKVATEHKELHGGISKIGKAIDRVSISSCQ